MVIDMNYWTKVFKRLALFFLLIIGMYFAFKLAVFYMPFLIAFIISLLVEPMIKVVAKHSKMTRKTSAILVLTIVSILIIGLLAWGIMSIISESSNLLQSLNGYIEKLYTKSQEIIASIDFSKIKLPREFSNILNSSSQDFLETVSSWIRNTLNSLLQTITSLPDMFIYIGITLVATYFICTDKLYILDQIEHHLPRTWVKRLMMHLREVISSLGCYLKAEAILVLISFIVTLIGLYAMNFMKLNVKYPLLAAIVIGFVDALPILGSGTVIIPWAVIAATDGDLNLAIALLVLLVIISIVRQLIEPKIVSKQIGIHPIFTLISMYTGFKAIGIIGLLLGPIILIILKNVFGTFIDKGLIKGILDRK